MLPQLSSQVKLELWWNEYVTYFITKGKTIPTQQEKGDPGHNAWLNE